VIAPSREAIEHAAPEGNTAASQWLEFEELTGVADLIESFAIGLKEAARRSDSVRVHGYIADLVRCVADARDAYRRIADLARLEAQK
jgi:hypothetical protein